MPESFFIYDSRILEERGFFCWKISHDLCIIDIWYKNGVGIKGVKKEKIGECGGII